MLRRILSLLLIIGVAVGCVLPRSAARGAQADPTGLDVVQGTYNTVLDRFYRPLDPPSLLADGWSVLNATLKRGALPPAPNLPPLPEDRVAAFAAFSQTYVAYVGALPDGVTPSSVAYAVAQGIVESPRTSHMAFLTPQSLQSILRQLSGNTAASGLGVQTTVSAPHIITAVAPNGPADKAGIMPGDVVLQVGDTDVSSTTSQQFSQAVSGDAGLPVTLTVSRGGVLLPITVTRGRYYFPLVVARLLPDGVAYLRLTQFVSLAAVLPDGKRVMEEIDADLDAFDAQGATGLVLDLRGNSGGSVTTTSELLGRFLPEDTLTLTRYDGRGHAVTGIVSGQMRPQQLPMAVLVDGNSASSSEVAAATLKESNRAVVVGARTEGALFDSLILSEPGGTAVQVAIAADVTAYQRYVIEGQGYPVDIAVADTRTADDYRLGRDPQLEAADAALANAPTPPAYQTQLTGLSQQQLSDSLSRYVPEAAAVPPTDHMATPVRGRGVAINHPDEAISLLSADPVALLQTYRARGWLGGFTQSFGGGTAGAGLNVNVDLYATAAGASAAAGANDFPEVRQPVQSPVEVGAETAAFAGQWLSAGQMAVTWRRDNVVFTVTYTDLPGFEQLEEAATVAQLVDQLYEANPLPGMLPSSSVPRVIGALPAAA